MGKYFKEFCDKQRKMRINGHVHDVIDMNSGEQDAAVIAYLKDDRQHILAHCYHHMSDDGKSECYLSLELVLPILSPHVIITSIELQRIIASPPYLSTRHQQPNHQLPFAGL